MPRRDGGVTLAKGHTEGFSVGFSRGGSGVRVEDGGRDGTVGFEGGGCPCGGGGGECQEGERGEELHGGGAGVGKSERLSTEEGCYQSQVHRGASTQLSRLTTTRGRYQEGDNCVQQDSTLLL